MNGFFHDLSLANGAVAFQETSQMVIELVSSETKLVIPAKRRWIRKAYQLKDIEFPQARLVSKLFHSILNDSERTILTSQEEMGGCFPKNVTTEFQKRTFTWSKLIFAPELTFWLPQM